MPTLRIYAGDTISAPVKAAVSGSVTWDFEKQQRLDSIELETVYNFNYTTSTDLPPVSSCTGARLTFDMSGIPELQGMRVTEISGPWVYLTEKETALTIDTTKAYTYGCVATSPYLEVWDEEPMDSIVKAAVGEYCDLGNVFAGVSVKNNRYIFDAMLGFQTCPIIYGRYKGSARIAFDSHLTKNKPYIDVTYTPAEISVSSATPQAGFVNEHADNLFSWAIGMTQKNTVGPVQQESAAVQWRIRDMEDIAEIAVPGGEMTLLIPAETFPDGLIEWRVCARSTAGAETGMSQWYQLTTVDEPPAAPDALTPSGGIRDGMRPILLSWRHNPVYSTDPTAFEIEIDAGEGFVPLTGKVLSGESSYSIPEKTLKSGKLIWRVRDYNTDDMVSDYSEAAEFIVRAAPKMPTVCAVESDTPRPEVTWISPEQRACQMRVCSEDGEVCWDSGSVFGTQQTLRVGDFLPDGFYRFEVRVENSSGLWSEWGSMMGTVRTKKRLVLSLDGEEAENGVCLRFSVDVTA